MNKFIVIAMYTPGTPYEKERERLIKSLDKINVRRHLYQIPNLGNWTKNGQQNAVVILKAMEEHDCNIVFVDADAEIKEYPILFDDYKYDMAIYPLCYNEERNTHSKVKTLNYLTGTMFWRNCPDCKELLNEWVEMNNSNTLIDEINIKTLLQSPKWQTFNWAELPIEYCYIENHYKFEGVENPVICHYQAGERFAHIINGAI